MQETTEGREREDGKARKRRKEESPHLGSGSCSRDRVLGLGDAEERERRDKREESSEVKAHGEDKGELRGLVGIGVCVAPAGVAKGKREEERNNVP